MLQAEKLTTNKYIFRIFVKKNIKMKRTIILLAILLIQFQTFAGNADAFSINTAEINAKMNDLTVLENYLQQHPSMTYSDVESSNQWLLSNVIQTKESPYITSSILLSQQMNDGDGCLYVVLISCCLTLGISVVYYIVGSSK
jgi:hypothetical protein